MTKLPISVMVSYPVKYFFDHNGDDIFKYKVTRKMWLCLFIIILVWFILLQIVRELCCKTVRYVKPKRLIDKDD